MTHTTIQIRKKGLVVIPEPVRIALGLKDGDIIEVDIKKVEKAQT